MPSPAMALSDATRIWTWDITKLPTTRHQDCGAPMRARTDFDLMAELGGTCGHSRPRVSTINPVPGVASFDKKKASPPPWGGTRRLNGFNGKQLSRLAVNACYWERTPPLRLPVQPVLTGLEAPGWRAVRHPEFLTFLLVDGLRERGRCCSHPTRVRATRVIDGPDPEVPACGTRQGGEGGRHGVRGQKARIADR